MSDLTKITVNLVPRAFAAMEDAAALTGDTKTGTVNRALQLYAFVVAELRVRGSELLMRDADGTLKALPLTVGVRSEP